MAAADLRAAEHATADSIGFRCPAAAGGAAGGLHRAVYRPVGGAAAGVAAGLLWDMYSTRLLGFNALLLLVIGCACGLLVRLLIRNNLLSAMLLTAAALVIQGVADWLGNYVILVIPDAGFVLLHTILRIWRTVWCCLR